MSAQTIRNATQDDVDRIQEIYAIARQNMRASGNPRQWGDAWPPVSLILEDIEKQQSYVFEVDGVVEGVFFFASGTDIEPTYRVIEDGNWIGSNTYGAIHRIASSGAVKGFAKQAFDWAYEQCGHVRIDTHHDNKIMQHVLKKNGFVHCGTIYVEEDDDPRLAFERI